MDKKVNINNMLNGLIGQANLEHARGKSKEALSLLQEAIRQAPRCVEVYNQISDIYADLKQLDKSFEYRLLAAHMCAKTSAFDWATLGDLAVSLERLEQAATCFEKAIKTDPTNWLFYEKRIDVLDAMCIDEQAIKTRLQAAKYVDCRTSQISFNFIQDLIKLVAEYYITQNNEEKAMEALEIFILRSREFGKVADAQHLTLLGMWMVRDRFEDCVKSILALQPGIKAVSKNGNLVFKIEFYNHGYLVEPFPPTTPIDAWIVEDCFQTQFLSRLIVNLIRSGLKDSVPKLIDELLVRPVVREEENCFLEVGRAYQLVDSIFLGVKYMEVLLRMKEFHQNADAWFLFGIFQQASNEIEKAQNSYKQVIQIQPNYIDARINLSTILQSLNKSDEALEILMDYDLESCSLLPDERLLLRQAEVLLQQNRTKDYVKCLRLILIPHFYVVNKIMMNDVKKVRHEKTSLNYTIKRKAFEAIRGSYLEKTIKRLGAVSNFINEQKSQLTGNQLHDFALNLSEYLYNNKEYAEMLHVVCYAYIQPKIHKTGLQTFKNLLFFASIKSENYSLAFEFLRFFYMHLMSRSAEDSDDGDNKSVIKEDYYLLFCRIFNAMNFVFCHKQNVCYHRFVMRALAKTPKNYALHMISGNNSLITGSYRHALGEYFRVWLNNRNDPLVCLLIGLTFTHMACKKDISSRHMVAARAMTFMKRYQKLRGENQEVNYNTGRMFHQLGMLTQAIYFYEKVLHYTEVPRVIEDCENIIDKLLNTTEAERYDMKKLAAHNLAQIYETSGNQMLAREVLENYCTI